MAEQNNHDGIKIGSMDKDDLLKYIGDLRQKFKNKKPRFRNRFGW